MPDFSFDFDTTKMLSKPLISSFSAIQQKRSDLMQERLDELEHKIRMHQGQEMHAEWLNEYLDIGLELANNNDARLKPLQESWLTRLYNTLRDAALNPRACGQWRHLCMDYLYQPFFVLTQIYKSEPNRALRLKSLRNEYAMINRII